LDTHAQSMTPSRIFNSAEETRQSYLIIMKHFSLCMKLGNEL